MSDAGLHIDPEEAVAATIDAAAEVDDPVKDGVPSKPRLLVESCNPDVTVTALRDILAEAGGLYDRGVPVRLAFDQMQKGMVAQVLTPHALVLEAHRVCRPYALKPKDGALTEVNVRLPHCLRA